MFDHKDFDAHEKVSFIHDKATGLKAIIAIHSTHLGPAAGGCRLWGYETPQTALGDALRLSRGMSYKNAMADLKFGGGKAVILGPIAPEKRIDAFEAFGRAIETMGGEYITAEDVGVSVADMRIVAGETRYVSGLDAAEGQSGGDPSPFTAMGIRIGIEAAVLARLNRKSLDGITVAVQGLGGVGGNLCQELHDRGAKLIIADINQDRAKSIEARFGAKRVSIDDILLSQCDVVAPCALGGAITVEVARALNAPIVAGGANNQLATLEAGIELAKRDILYTPDYVINAGGIIMVSGEYFGNSSTEQTLKAIEAIGPRLGNIFAQAKAKNLRPETIADEMAQEKLSGEKAKLSGAKPSNVSKLTAPQTQKIAV